MFWLTANWQCHTEGGHLIILDSSAKIRVIQNAASDFGVNTVWVGGSDLMVEHLPVDKWAAFRVDSLGQRRT